VRLDDRETQTGSLNRNTGGFAAKQVFQIGTGRLALKHEHRTLEPHPPGNR